MTARAQLQFDSPAPPRLALSVNDACAALSIGRTTFYKLVKCGRIRIIRIVGRTVVPVREIERLLASDHAAEEA